MSYKILVLTKYGSLGGSSRYRFYQYLPYLKSQGFDLTIAPMLDNNYVANINSGRRNISNIFSNYFQRLARLFTDRDYDLLWIEKEVLPYLPAWLEKLAIRDLPYVVDYDDAQFHRYDMFPPKIFRMFFSKKIDKVMANANLVVAGNEYIAQRARQAGAKQIEIIPTVIDLDRYSSKTSGWNQADFNIGWIGSPATSIYLKPIQPVFENLAQTYHSRITLVGSGKLKLGDLDLTIEDWHEQTEVENIQTFDVGIMPLDNTPWERGKCGIKLIQYMACALPVVGTPIGVNQEIIQHGVNGFHANSLSDWKDCLSKLATDRQLCHDMGAEGRLMVESKYCLQVTAPRLAHLLRCCI
jgi:glycosyltransferase involved in cell wall biosynthesis